MDICTLRRRRDPEQVESISLSMRKSSPPKWKMRQRLNLDQSMKLEILHPFFSCLCCSEWWVFNAQQLLRTQRRTAQKAWSLLGHKAGTFKKSRAERGKKICCPGPHTKIISNQCSRKRNLGDLFGVLSWQWDSQASCQADLGSVDLDAERSDRFCVCVWLEAVDEDGLRV